MWGFKNKRSKEEQKEYEQKVFTACQDKTVLFVGRLFRITGMDKALFSLQLFTSRHRKTTVSVLGGCMVLVLTMDIFYAFQPGSASEPFPLSVDSLRIRVPESGGSFLEVFDRKSPRYIAERMIMELDIDTAKYRKDRAYRIGVNRQILLRYGGLDSLAKKKLQQMDSVKMKKAFSRNTVTEK